MSVHTNVVKINKHYKNYGYDSLWLGFNGILGLAKPIGLHIEILTWYRRYPIKNYRWNQ